MRKVDCEDFGEDWHRPWFVQFRVLPGLLLRIAFINLTNRRVELTMRLLG